MLPWNSRSHDSSEDAWKISLVVGPTHTFFSPKFLAQMLRIMVTLASRVNLISLLSECLYLILDVSAHDYLYNLQYLYCMYWFVWLETVVWYLNTALTVLGVRGLWTGKWHCHVVHFSSSFVKIGHYIGVSDFARLDRQVWVLSWHTIYCHIAFSFTYIWSYKKVALR